MSIGNFPESLSRAMLVGVMLVGGLGVVRLIKLPLGADKIPVGRGVCLWGRLAWGRSAPHKVMGRVNLFTTTTTKRGWCIEAFVSIQTHLQSQKLFPGGGGV